MEPTEKAKATFTPTGDWASHTKVLQSKHTQLTDADLKLETGKENEMIKRVQERLNKGREEVVNILNKVQTTTS